MCAPPSWSATERTKLRRANAWPVLVGQDAAARDERAHHDGEAGIHRHDRAWRELLAGVNVAESGLHAEVREQRGRAPSVVDKVADRHREPLPLGLVALVVCAGRPAKVPNL